MTSVLKNQATALQVALGILLRDSKTIVNKMYDYRVTCSYDELLRFKKSAAVAASTNPSKQGISDARQGLIQVVADNFDCDIMFSKWQVVHSFPCYDSYANRLQR